MDFALVSVLPKGLSVNDEVLVENELYVIGNKAVKKIRKIAKNKEFYIGNEVIFHDNISMKYLCICRKQISYCWFCNTLQ